MTTIEVQLALPKYIIAEGSRHKDSEDIFTTGWEMEYIDHCTTSGPLFPSPALASSLKSELIALKLQKLPSPPPEN